MLKKVKCSLILSSLTVLLFATSVGFAQPERAIGGLGERPDRIDSKGQGRIPTLGCCKCLGETSSINLSTVPGNNWTVSGGPAFFLTSPNSNWNLPTSGASWISTAANGASGSLPAGVKDYQLKFVVQKCTIPQKVTLTGSVGGDDDISVYLDNTASTPLSTCSGGWCFNTKNPPPAISTNVLPGSHTLIVRVNNGGGSPSGMFVNATLTGSCSTSPTKTDKDQ